MKNLSRHFVWLAFILLPFSSLAQNHATTMKVQAMDMAAAFVKNDFNGFVKYMHPNIIKYAGGKDVMKTKMDSGFVAMKKYGVSIKKYLIGSPTKIIQHKNQLQAILPQTSTLRTPFGEVTVETAFIVISHDKGKNWWFIDTNVYQVDKLKEVLPELSPKLVLPPKSTPKLVKPGEEE